MRKTDFLAGDEPCPRAEIEQGYSKEMRHDDDEQDRQNWSATGNPLDGGFSFSGAFDFGLRIFGLVLRLHSYHPACIDPLAQPTE